MLTIRAVSDGTGYSARHLEHSDYYVEGERVTGQWQCRGAELLGLAGVVQSEQFEELRQGLDPETGEFLRQRHSADRIGADGTTQSRGRNLMTSPSRLRSQFPLWPNWAGTTDWWKRTIRPLKKR